MGLRLLSHRGCQEMEVSSCYTGWTRQRDGRFIRESKVNIQIMPGGEAIARRNPGINPRRQHEMHVIIGDGAGFHHKGPRLQRGSASNVPNLDPSSIQPSSILLRSCGSQGALLLGQHRRIGGEPHKNVELLVGAT